MVLEGSREQEVGSGEQTADSRECAERNCTPGNDGASPFNALMTHIPGEAAAGAEPRPEDMRAASVLWSAAVHLS